MKRIKLNPPQIITLGFLAVIIIGAVLLTLPISASTGKAAELIDGLFTATSATCVTGLVVKDTGSFFSPFGKFVIIILIQTGGLGIMTLSTLFSIILGRRLTISDNITVQSALDHQTPLGFKVLVLYIVIFTFFVETTGALLLSIRWINICSGNWLISLKKGIFHSVSAFCNAGFALFPDSLCSFRSDWVSIAIISALIIIGGMGFVVFLEVPKLKFWEKKGNLLLSRISLQAKIVFLLTALLIIIGTIAILAFEADNTLRDLSLKDRIWNSLFTSITPRTAGFETLPTSNLRPVSLFLLIMLMFIGASPGGTGGGIKTVTFAVILASFYTFFYNKDRISLFGRTIPRQTYRKAVSVLFLSMAIVGISTFLLSATEYFTLKGSNYFLSLLFESTSAFGTVGLSTGITPYLTPVGKLIIICTMFAGRVGPLTLALAVMMHREKIDYKYPEEQLMVG